MPRRTKFPICCGCDIIWGFGEPTTKTIENLKVQTTSVNGFLLAILAGYQKMNWGRHLLACGFKEVSSVVNHNSSNRITLYIKERT